MSNVGHQGALVHNATQGPRLQGLSTDPSSTPVSFHLKATAGLLLTVHWPEDAPVAPLTLRGWEIQGNHSIAGEYHCFCFLSEVENFPTKMAVSSEGITIPLTKRVFLLWTYIPIFNLTLLHFSNNFWNKSLNQEGKNSPWLRLYSCSLLT